MGDTTFSVVGKTVCITCASSGIGRHLASHLACQGANVVAVARRQDALADWEQSTTGNVASVAADLGDIENISAIGDKIAAHFGDVDILINAAGLNPRLHASEINPAQWQQTIDINLSASFFLAQKFVPAMQAKGWGRVINFASLQSRRAFANGIAYGASKGGVEQMTRAMAEAWSSTGIGCNAIAPGFFPTELTAKVFDDADLAQKNADQTCIGRNGKLRDLEGPVMFLASPASDYVTGQVLFVDGGFTAK